MKKSDAIPKRVFSLCVVLLPDAIAYTKAIMQERTHFGLVIALWAAGLGAGGQFAKIAVIFDQIAGFYPGSGAWLGFVVSTLSLLGILLGLFAGLIVARIGFRRLLLIALVLGAVLSAFQATLPPLPVMLASRLVEGASHLIIVVAAPTLIAEVSAPRHRPAAMTLWSTFFGVSFALFAWLGGPMAATFGASALFLAHAGLMVTVALALFILLPPQRQLVDQAPLSIQSIIQDHVAVYKSPHRAAPAFGWLFYTLTYVSMLTIVPGLVSDDSRAFVAGAMPLAGMVVSMTIGVLLLRRYAAVGVVIGGFALALILTPMFWFFPESGWLAIAIVGALGLVQGASFAAIPQLNQDPASRAHANGAMAQTGNLGNTLGTPILLALITTFGISGLIGFTFFCYAFGIAVHVWLGRRRAEPRL